MEEERAQPAGLDLSLDELINASKSAGRKGGRGGGRGSGGRGGRGGGFRQQRGIDEGGAGPIRRHPGGQMRAQQPMQQIQYAMPRFQPPLPQYSRAPPPLPQGPPPGTQFGRGGGGFGSRDRPPQTSKQYKQASHCQEPYAALPELFGRRNARSALCIHRRMWALHHIDGSPL